MAKFFVGQRVRILRSENWPELAGSEGRVVGFISEADIGDPRCEVRVAPDEWGSERCPMRLGRNGARRFAPPSSNLEPILPEGSAPSGFTFQQLMDSLQEVSA
jgi:hypothetical protein